MCVCISLSLIVVIRVSPHRWYIYIYMYIYIIYTCIYIYDMICINMQYIICCPTRPPWSPCLSKGTRTSWRSSFKLDSLDTASGLSWHCVARSVSWILRNDWNLGLGCYPMDHFPGWKLTFGSIWFVSECLFDIYISLRHRATWTSNAIPFFRAWPSQHVHIHFNLWSASSRFESICAMSRSSQGQVTAGCTNSGQLPGSQETCLGDRVATCCSRKKKVRPPEFGQWQKWQEFPLKTMLNYYTHISLSLSLCPSLSWS